MKNKMLLSIFMFFLIFSFQVQAIDITSMAKGLYNNFSSKKNNSNITSDYEQPFSHVDAYLPDSSNFAYHNKKNKYTGRYQVITNVFGEICFDNAQSNPLSIVYDQMRRKAYENNANLIINVKKQIIDNPTDLTCPHLLKTSGIAVEAEKR